MIYKNYFKRLGDLFGSVLGILILSPIFIFLTAILAIINRGSPFFFQARPGKDERIFKIIKFKTMTDSKDKNGNLLPDKDRLTKIGMIVRKTSLDEIPQLLNILKGDMSIIGPRPLRVRYLEFYNDIQRKRHNVRPGLTGLAQITGRNAISWSKKFEYDVYYVNNVSLKLDWEIFKKTFFKVFKGSDVSAANTPTTKSFNGNN